MEIKQRINSYLHKKQRAASLAAFRIFFGVLMLISLIRFLSKGWVYKFYIEPKFHFKYYGFSWVQTWGEYTYVLFAIAIIATIGIILGYKYKLSILLFFISFTYIELIDKTTYLNHYYFISILSFLLCFLPLNVYFSLDAYYKKKTYEYVPKWTVDSIKLLLSIVYFYAGLAKLNSDWLFRAQPLKIWLSTKTDFPIIGQYMNDTWFHFAMSWGGMLYDLTIPFLLFYKRTRLLAFLLVVFFHVFTRILFPIGMFPYIMIVSTLIFFDANFHLTIINFIKQGLSRLTLQAQSRNLHTTSSNNFELQKIVLKTFRVPKIKIILPILILFFTIQLLLPFRYVLYPGELFWTEEGYRFSWRVMLIEKAGYTNFRILKKDSGNSFMVENGYFLNAFQSKQMATQPDFILEYAHFLGNHYKKELKTSNIAVFAEGYLSLNGRRSQQFINPSIDLLTITDNFTHKNWITPLQDEIKGL